MDWLPAGLYSLQRTGSLLGITDIYNCNGGPKMKLLIMLTIAGVVMSIWCPTGLADRLYTCSDKKG
jgi:hypothetical protein